ncbi:MAG: PadR family transcriptional regulator [Candidatus Aminicenantes bacterium]|nr:PadR family transcriptional regulator [Candidatus Aminicenantes bacterium]
MKLLSRIEEIILLAVLRLGADAYGLTICREVSRVTEKDWLVGAIYAPLARLHKNGHVEIRPGPQGVDPAENRRIYYLVTPQGLEALGETRRITARGWLGLSDPKTERP